MEEKIKAAKSITSWSGLICKLISIIGALGALSYGISMNSKSFQGNLYFWSIFSAAIGSSASIGALGSIASYTKKNQALTALLVESTNSASPINLSRTYEYSDLNEDT